MLVHRDNCRIRLLVLVIFRKLKQNWRSDDDAVLKLCSQRWKVPTVKLTSTNADDICEISAVYNQQIQDFNQTPIN